ncbi:hypothetical protein LY474_31555 [Myxococcus stipitatus]|uniref:hypothetical protein n=1 Tax=Myxococcus stipitatus TaxID=83455 RepID=UPI001F1D4E48|nr:hypothetical protein [Myxococcus stipitatus]MCE9672352.1 hypothetical protein [Myxococcus stipitatus]
MRILTGVAIEGRWPRGLREWWIYLFLMGDIRSRRMQLFAILWFFACGAAAIIYSQVVLGLKSD